jgi:cytochrome c biogenesis protein CcmG/thiol:disulfide interchange protein DsbE
MATPIDHWAIDFPGSARLTGMRHRRMRQPAAQIGSNLLKKTKHFGTRGHDLGRRVRVLALLLMAATALAATPPPDGQLDLGRLRGHVVVVDFWASWCAPCRRSIPWLNAMQAKYADRGLVVIGVNVDKERRDAEKFLAETPASFEILFDSQGELPAKYGVSAMPSSYVFDGNGTLIAKHLGFQVSKREDYEEVLRKLVSVEERKP